METNENMIQDIKVREIQIKDIKPLLEYWYSRTAEDFLAMGADMSKFPSRKQFDKMLRNQIATPMHEKNPMPLSGNTKANKLGIAM